jgi:hypothetical protein
MELRAAPDLVIVISQRFRRTLQQRCQPGFALDQRQGSQILAIQVQQIEEEEDQRSLVSIGRVLDDVKGSPTIREHPAKFPVKVGVPRREPSNGLGDGGVFLCPVVAPARQDLRSARVEPSVHPISIELDFVQPVRAGET